MTKRDRFDHAPEPPAGGHWQAECQVCGWPIYQVYHPSGHYWRHLRRRIRA